MKVKVILAFAALIGFAGGCGGGGSDSSTSANIPVFTGPGVTRDNTQRIVFQREIQGNLDIFTMNPDGSDWIRVTDDPGDDAQPSWSPDRTKIAFASNRGGQRFAIFTVDADGKNARLIYRGIYGDKLYPKWSPDGKKIAFLSEEAQSSVAVVDVATLDTVKVTYEPGVPTWSPDGKQIAFAESGALAMVSTDTLRIHALIGLPGDGSSVSVGAPDWNPVRDVIAISESQSGANLSGVYAFDPKTLKASQVTTGTDSTPRWSPDGAQLVFNRQGKNGNSAYVCNADGSGVHQISDATANVAEMDW